MKNIAIQSLALLLAAFASLTSCQKDKEDFYNLELEIDYKVGSADFSYDQVYTINGIAVKFSLFQVYLSGLKVEDHDGNHKHFEEKYLLVKPTQKDYMLGSINKAFGDHVHDLKFNVGIDAATNSQTTETFTSRNANDPLAAQNPAMHWSWNSGYIFIKIEGEVDTDGDGSPDTAAQWHVGLNEMLRPVSIEAHSDMKKGDNHIHLKLDVAKVFTGIDMTTEISTHSMGANKPIAVKVADNIATAFSKMH